MRGFQQHIFHHIVMISFIRLYVAPFRDITSEGFEHTHITLCTWSQETLDWLAIFGHQERHVAPLTIALLTRHTSSIFLVLGSLRPWNPVMVTDNDGKAIKDVD